MVVAVVLSLFVIGVWMAYSLGKARLAAKEKAAKAEKASQAGQRPGAIEVPAKTAPPAQAPGAEKP